MANNTIENVVGNGKISLVVRDVTSEFEGFFARDPLFGFYGVADEGEKFPIDSYLTSRYS